MKVILLLIIYTFSFINTKNAYDNLVEWGRNNSFFISDKLGMRYVSENNKTFYSKEDIPKDTLLMTIPFKMILNLKNALELLDNKKINKLYSEHKKNASDVSLGFFTSDSNQTFLSYLIYLVNHRQKQYKKNKFYQYFKYLFDTFETNLDNYPLFFNENQLQLLHGSVTIMDITLLKELFQEEVDKFENIYHQKKIDFEEYLRYRTLVISKSLNISELSIIPFIDMFEGDPIDYNVEFGISESKLNIFTTRNVRRDNTFYIRSGYISNIKRFILYGQTYEKMDNYIDSFDIPMISFKLYKSIVKNDENYDFSNTLDLSKKKFYKKALKAYKELSTLNKEDGSDISAYKLLIKNLETMKKGYAPITTSDIYKQFVHLKDINNVKRILDFEKRFINEKINAVKKIVDKLIKDNKKNNDL